MYQIRISLYLEAITLESKYFARLLKALTNSALLTEVNQQVQPTYDVTYRIRAQAPLSSPKLNACVGGYIGRRQFAALAHRKYYWTNIKFCKINSTSSSVMVSFCGYEI